MKADPRTSDPRTSLSHEMKQTGILQSGKPVIVPPYARRYARAAKAGA